MFRRFVCILSVTGMVLALGVGVQAEEVPGPAAHQCMDADFYPVVATETEIPKTGDYPAPILTGMLLSMGVVILMAVTENRKK